MARFTAWRFLAVWLAVTWSGGGVWAQAKLSPAQDAEQAVDSRLEGKTAAWGTISLFTATADYEHGLKFERNPNLWCADLTVYLTCFSPWNSNEHLYQGGTLVSPKNALFAEHFSGASGSNTLHGGEVVKFVGETGVIYPRTLTGTPVRVGNTDICVGTFTEGPLPPDVLPAEVLPAGLPVDWLPMGTPVLFCNKEKQVRVGEVVSFGGCAIAPATARNRAAWTEDGPAHVGDSGSPVFVVLGGRPVLWWLFHSPGGGPSVSENIEGINALLAKGYKLRVADVGGKR